MEAEALVSVIIPVYNVEEYVAECLESVMKQSYHNLEIILVNDGSTDSSDAICRKYLKKDSRIRVVEQEHGGLSRARNTGIKTAKGLYYAFIDSDDWIDSCMIEKLLTQLLQYNADVSCCNFEKFESASKRKKHKVSINGQVVYNQQEAKEHFLLEDSFMCYSWNKLYKAELFENIHYPEDKFYEDIITTYKIISKCKKIVFCKECYYHYRIRNKSITNSGFSVKDYDLISAIRDIKKQEENTRIWIGCAVYYLFFLDDMIRANQWDWQIYREFRFIFLQAKKANKIFPFTGYIRGIQLLWCYYAIYSYQKFYKLIRR